MIKSVLYIFFHISFFFTCFIPLSQTYANGEYPSFSFDKHYYQIFIRPDGVTDIIQDSSGIERFSRNNINTVGPFIKGTQFSDIHGVHNGKKIEVEFQPSSLWKQSINKISRNSNFTDFYDLEFKPHTVPGDTYSWFFHYKTQNIPLKKVHQKDNRFYVFYWQPVFNKRRIEPSVIEIVFPIIYNPDRKQIYKDSIFIDRETSRNYGKITFFQTPWQRQFYLSIRATTAHSPYQNKPFYLLLRKDLFSYEYEEKITEVCHYTGTRLLAENITENENLFPLEIEKDLEDTNPENQIDQDIESKPEDFTPSAESEPGDTTDLNGESNPSKEESGSAAGSDETTKEKPGDHLLNDPQSDEIQTLRENTEGIPDNEPDEEKSEEEINDPELPTSDEIDSEKDTSFNYQEAEELNKPLDYEIIKLVQEIRLTEKNDQLFHWSITPSSDYLIHEKYIFFIQMNDSEQIKKLLRLKINYYQIHLRGYSSNEKNRLDKSDGNPVSFRIEKDNDHYITIIPEDNKDKKKYAYYSVIIDNHYLKSLEYLPSYHDRKYSVLFDKEKVQLSKETKMYEAVIDIPAYFQFSQVRDFQSDFIALFPIKFTSTSQRNIKSKFSRTTLVPGDSNRIFMYIQKTYAGCIQNTIEPVENQENDKLIENNHNEITKDNSDEKDKPTKECTFADPAIEPFREIKIDEKYINQLSELSEKPQYESFPFSEVPNMKFSMQVLKPINNILYYPIFAMKIFFHDTFNLNLYPELIIFFYISMLIIFAFALSLVIVHPAIFLTTLIIYLPVHFFFLRLSIFDLAYNKILFPSGIRFFHLSAGIVFSYNAYLIPFRYIIYGIKNKRLIQNQKTKIRNKTILADPPLSKNSICYDLSEPEACIITGKLSDSVITMILIFHHTGFLQLESLQPFSVIKDFTRKKSFENYYNDIIMHLKEDQIDLKFLRRYLDIILSAIIEKTWEFNYIKTQNFYYNKFQTYLEIYEDLKGSEKNTFLLDNIFWLMPNENFRKKHLPEMIRLMPTTHKLSRFIKRKNMSSSDLLIQYEELKKHISEVISMINIKDVLNER